MKKIDANCDITYPLYFCECDTIGDLARVDVPSKYFTLLVCADFRDVTMEEMFVTCERLLEKGIGYFCVWGPNCEWAHDIFDEAISARIAAGEYVSDEVIMSTWHNEESLDEALWFILFCATVGSEHDNDCCTVIASIGNKQYARKIEENLDDIAAFNKRLCND